MESDKKAKRKGKGEGKKMKLRDLTEQVMSGAVGANILHARMIPMIRRENLGGIYGMVPFEKLVSKKKKKKKRSGYGVQFASNRRK